MQDDIAHSQNVEDDVAGSYLLSTLVIHGRYLPALNAGRACMSRMTELKLADRDPGSDTVIADDQSLLRFVRAYLSGIDPSRTGICRTAFVCGMIAAIETERLDLRWDDLSAYERQMLADVGPQIETTRPKLVASTGNVRAIAGDDPVEARLRLLVWWKRTGGVIPCWAWKLFEEGG